MKTNSIVLISVYLVVLMISHVLLTQNMSPWSLIQDVLGFNSQDHSGNHQQRTQDEEVSSEMDINSETVLKPNNKFITGSLAQELESHLDSAIKPNNFFDDYCPSNFPSESIVDSSAKETEVDISLIQDTQFKDPEKERAELPELNLSTDSGDSEKSSLKEDTTVEKSKPSPTNQTALSLLNVSNLLAVEPYNNYDSAYANF